MQETTLKSIVWQEGSYFVAQCLVVDVSSFGETREEALHNLDEALSLYFEDQPFGELPSVIDPEIVDAHIRYA
ncbi:type II toxin-antitoxin system HicB family antitoxin [Spirosoma gilvum]